MKKKLIGTALFLVLPLAAQVRRVAVYDFDTNGVRDDVSKAFGSATKNVGRT